MGRVPQHAARAFSAKIGEAGGEAAARELPAACLDSRAGEGPTTWTQHMEHPFTIPPNSYWIRFNGYSDVVSSLSFHPNEDVLVL